MNKNRLILLAFLLGTTWFYAQGPVRDRIKTLKVAFITERVGLTSEEAQSFWPIYNEHEEKLEAIRRKERRERISLSGDLSNGEASALLDKLLALQNEKHEIHKTFISRIRKVISPKKTLLLMGAEEDFKKRLLQQYRKRREGG
ncbi:MULTISPECIES: hypothetical protein [Flavobacteriaceae]|uniref:hypothetical protein n=1 Tax=Flavobacteriaceae TaxID=49546 RepID=UPI001492B94E|nr:MULTISPECIES: hypothetical protein [Allomuricauda]MDC6365072.1 hypothetical protein [Muricauda sp. AC10]